MGPAVWTWINVQMILCSLNVSWLCAFVKLVPLVWEDPGYPVSSVPLRRPFALTAWFSVSVHKLALRARASPSVAAAGLNTPVPSLPEVGAYETCCFLDTVPVLLAPNHLSVKSGNLHFQHTPWRFAVGTALLCCRGSDFTPLPSCPSA